MIGAVSHTPSTGPEPLSFLQVDSFAERPFTGNPAAVVWLGASADDAWLQAVAAEMNLSETAFLTGPCGPEAEWGLRWMTPSVEVDLCGHATLAAAHALWERGLAPADEPIRFATRSGGLICRRRDDGWIWMDFPTATAAALPVDQAPALLFEALGLQPGQVLSLGRNLWDLVVELASEREVVRLAPEMARLAAVDARGVIATAPADPAGEIHRRTGADFVSRFFGPRVGVPEDPVTGSAHCLLGPFWRERLGKATLTGFQASRRGGSVRIELAAGAAGADDEPERIHLGGRAVTVLEGTLRVSPG